jgi:hypothetical protein
MLAYPRETLFSRRVADVFLHTTTPLAERDNSPDVLAGQVHGDFHDRFFDRVEFRNWRHLRRAIHNDDLAVSLGGTVDDVGRSGDEIDRVLPLQALLNDLHVQQSQKTAPEAKAQGFRRIRLEAERSVIEMQFAEGLAQVIVLGCVGGKQPGKHHGLDLLEPGQRGARWVCRRRDRVADLGVLDALDACRDESDLTGAEFFQVHGLGAETAKRCDLERTAR